MRQMHIFADFTAGLNTDAASDHLGANELLIADNIDLSVRGGTKKRNGMKAINSSYEANVTSIFEWPRNNGDVIKMAIIGGKLCEINATNQKTEIGSVSLPKVGQFAFQDKLYYLSGTDYMVYDGTTATSVPPHSNNTNDLEPIKGCKFAVRHVKSQRFFYAGNSNEQAALYFSEPGQPDYVKETSKLFPSTGDGPITGLAIFVDAVLVFFKRSIWVWRGIDPEIDAVWHKLPTSEGTIAPYSICHSKTGLMYLGERAIINLSPSIIGMNVELETKDQAVYHVTEKRIENLIRGIISPKTTSAAYNSKTGEYYLSYSDVEGDFILVIDENLGIVRWSGIKANDVYYSYDGELLIATENYILKPSSTYEDTQPDGTTQNVSMVVQTPQYALGSHMQRKLLTRYQVVAQGENEDTPPLIPIPTTFNVEVLVDDKTAVSETFEMEPTENLFLARKQFRKTGNRVSVIVKSDDNKPFTLYGIGIEAKVINSYGERV